jgi:hypothetical protein
MTVAGIRVTATSGIILSNNATITLGGVRVAAGGMPAVGDASFSFAPTRVRDVAISFEGDSYAIIAGTRVTGGVFATGVLTGDSETTISGTADRAGIAGIFGQATADLAATLTATTAISMVGTSYLTAAFTDIDEVPGGIAFHPDDGEVFKARSAPHIMRVGEPVEVFTARGRATIIRVGPDSYIFKVRTP